MKHFFRERMIGKAATRRYDLPLNKGSGTGFLVLLIGLMTFLAVLALAASFALGAMTKRWSSGLENRATVEIPAKTENDKLLTPEEVAARVERVDNLLKSHPGVKETHILSETEIRELVKPWLGDNLILDKVPLPGLISVTLQDSSPDTLKAIEGGIASVSGNARLDTHESWLHDVLRFTGALKFAAAVITLVIGFTAVTAVAGAVRSRMAIHSADVELLHLMGASDSYIARQFQRHSMTVALQGAVAGAVVGALVLTLVGWISGQMGVNLLPDFNLNVIQMLGIAVLPGIAAVLAIATARHTVLQTLNSMP